MSRVRKPPKDRTAPQPASPLLQRDWRPHVQRLFLLWTVALIAYSNSFRTGLIFDNSTIILQDTRIRALTSGNIGLIVSQEYWYNTLTTGLYRPLATFSYLLNYAVLGNGTRPAGYHWVNLLLHGINISLVYLLGLAVFEKRGLAFGLAAVWGVHPLLTESVTNVVGRADLMAASGVLGGLLCHVASAHAPRKLAWRCGLALAAAIAIFSKESGAVLPGLMLLYDVCWSKRADWPRRAIGYLAVAAAFSIYFYLQMGLHARMPLGLVPFGDNPLTATDFWTSKLTAIKVIGKYLWLFLWPARLSADYSYNAVPLSTWRDAGALAAIAACLAAGAIAVFSYRRQRYLFFFIVFFFIALAPTSNLTVLAGTIMAERFLYLPSIGLAACMVVAASQVKPQRGARVAVALICLAYAGRTFARNFDWMDERTLWERTASASPGSFKAHSLLAANLMDSDLDRAVAEADRSLVILQGLPPELDTVRPYVAAAICYRRKGELDKALAALLHGETIDRLTQERIRALNLAHGKRAAPRASAPLYLELGRVYVQFGDLDRAAEAFARGRLTRPDAEFFEELSRAWLAKGDWERAAVPLIEGILMDANAARLAGSLLELYRQNAPDSCAVAASNINMECPLVHNQLCTASRNVARSYSQNGQPEKAAATARGAVESLGCPAQ